MKINFRAVVKAIAILVLLTIVPLAGQRYIPAEVLRFLSSTSGFDLIKLLDRLAVLGVAFAALVLVRGHTEKTSGRYLVLSVANKVLWFTVVLFVLGVGYPETGGVAMLGGSSAGSTSIVAIDLRLYAVLVALILALMTVRSVLQYQEASEASSRSADSIPPL